MKVVTTKVPKSVGVTTTLAELLEMWDGMELYPEGGFNDDNESYTFDTSDEVTVTVGGKVVKPEAIKLRIIDSSLRDQEG